MVIFDDIGSYPLPEEIGRKEVLKDMRRFHEIVRDAMEQKIRSGVEIPTYPQFQPMIDQFLSPMMKKENVEEPLLIKEEKAEIIELQAIESLAKEIMEKKGERLRIRICVTGPVELYFGAGFGSRIFEDVLLNIANSINRFIKRSIERTRYAEISVVSIDEPSIGINPFIKEEEIFAPLEIASEFAHRKGIDTQIHLHSPIYYRRVCEIRGIDIIGVESASNPSYLDLIDKKDLEKSDKFLRIGVSRTDIFAMASDYNERHGVNVFKEKERMEEMIEEYETPSVIKKRLERAYSTFGERIRYAGPDCGLGSWPTQELAFKLLENTRKGIDSFRRDR
ncbi:MAG: methionine synthase [Candidatus Syntropharchaeia archaeon]